MSDRQRGSQRSFVNIRPQARELVNEMARRETRAIIDQMEVIIREAAERRGITPADPAQSSAA